MNKSDILYGKYQHYKNHKLYEVIGVAFHTETQEEMVIYKALYSDDLFYYGQLWARPKKIFLEAVDYNGSSIPRFKKIE